MALTCYRGRRNSRKNGRVEQMRQLLHGAVASRLASKGHHMASNPHATSIVIDGLIISNFGRPVFEDMRKGGLTAGNCTCCVWDGFTDTMRNVVRWKKWFNDHSDLLKQVYTTEDILAAKQEGKTGIILGWQNISGIEDQIGYLVLFIGLGVGVLQ